MVWALALLSAALPLAGCGAPASAPPPTPAPSAGDVIHGLANVERIDVLILESFPVQVNVIAYGNLPDGCTTIDRVEQVRTGQQFVVTITTARPAAAACTEALVPFQQAVALDVLGLPAGTYTVSVNGVAGSFELAQDNG
jgi:inhibitor of cysteine peptidase